MKFKAFFQIILSLGFFVSAFLLVHTEIFAVTVGISQFPSAITQDAFTITASISGATSGINYVRIDIYKEGTTNYFGETFNGNDWYGGSDYKQYLAVQIVNGQWSGTIQGSIGSPSTTEYDGVGTYRIRVRRYTGGGSTTASEADNSSVSVRIVMPTPTPTPAPTNTPVPTNSASSAASPPTATNKPSLTPTTKPSLSPTISQVLALATISADASEDGSLVEDERISPTPIQKVAGLKSQMIPTLLIALGGVMVIGCGILFVYKYRLGKDDEDNSNE